MKNQERSGSTENQDFELKKRKFLSSFALAHMSAFRLHYKKGETLGKREGVWRSVSEHCLVEGVFADILAEELGLSTEERVKVVQAALLHDWFKKHEATAQRAALSRGQLTSEVMNAIKENDKKGLEDFGVPEDVIKLAGANIPQSEEGPSSLPEKIVWYVDAMMMDTNPVSIQDRFDKLEQGWDGFKNDHARAQRNLAFSDFYRERYGGKSLYEVQRRLGEVIGREFARSIGYQGEIAALPLALRDKFIERVNRFEP